MKLKHRSLVRVCLMTVILVMAVGLTGCNSKTNKNNDKYTIIATLFPQYDFAKQIGGEYVDVIMLLPPGVESHAYDLRPSDMIAIKESDMFIYTGEYMETWAATIIESLDDDIVVVDVSEGIELVKGTHDHEHEHGEHDAHEQGAEEHTDHEGEQEGNAHDEASCEVDTHIHEVVDTHEGHSHEYDPHIWTSPVNAMKMVETITKALCEAMPEHEAEFVANAEAYLAELGLLDGAFRELTEENEHNIIFFGGKFAMSYFAEEYGFECVLAYPDCSAESEPSISRVMNMIDEIKAHDIGAIYYEELADPKVARTIAEETGVKLLLLHSAHNVTRDEFEAGITYLDIMWQNVENLKEGMN